MSITAKQLEVLKAAPIEGGYILPLGGAFGRWMYEIGNQSVTRQVNALIKAGLMQTDAPPAGNGGNHPQRWKAKAVPTEAAKALLETQH